MTKKRFEWDNVNIAIKDIQSRKKYYIDITCIDEVVELLNELDSENQRLKLENDGLRYALKNIKQIDVEIDIGD